MLRILGFILGSAVSIAAILLVLGVPEFHFSNTEFNQARFDAALDKIRQSRPDIEETVEQFVADLKQHSGQPTEPTPAEESVSDMVAQEAPTPVNKNSSRIIPDELPGQTGRLAITQDIAGIEQQWHEFWNPFRSEIAARGFVSQLEKVTGLDYRIFKVKAGVYQVGFAFANDVERQLKLSQISAATGLDLPQI